MLSLLRSAARISRQPIATSTVASRWSRRMFATVPTDEQDLVVIGGGPGGYVAAIKAGQLGKKVTCVEKRATLGGTCLNVGCIPSKALLHASHLYHDAAHNYAKYGVVVDKVAIDLPAMMKSKDKAVTGLTRGIAGLFKKNKVSHAPGVGTIKSPTEVAVTAADGSVGVIKTKNILIATGSDIVGLPFLKIDEQTVVSSTGALSLSSVPNKMVVIGGGVIGLELGSVWSRLGAQVTVVEFLPRIAAGADAKIATEFQKILTKQGIQFKTSTKVTGVSKEGNIHKVTVEPAAGGAGEVLDADVILVSVGRRPYTDNLGLQDVGVRLDTKGRVEVDDQFRTNVPSIRAIGDVIRGPMLAHKSEEEGIAAVEFMFKNSGHVNYDAIPSVIYTNPEVAWVGKTEEELTAAGVAFRVGTFPFLANSRARTNDDADGLVKVLADAKTDQILGVHMIGNAAGEMIGEVTLAMEYGASSEDVARTCHAHPTLSEAVKEAAMATYDKPIHF